MEVVCSFETLVRVWTARHIIPEDGSIQVLCETSAGILNIFSGKVGSMSSQNSCFNTNTVNPRVKHCASPVEVGNLKFHVLRHLLYILIEICLTPLLEM
jgi:hypothetical protein